MSDDATPRLGLPYVAAGQAQKHITVNEAFSRLDGLVQTGATSRTVAAQPASPSDGALYILPAASTGAAWTGMPAGALMRFEAGAWTRLYPAAGAQAYVADEGVVLVHDGADWTHPAFPGLTAAKSAHGAATGLAILEEEVTLSGATSVSAIAIPARTIVLGVLTRTTQAVAGATSYGCGVAGEPAKFGDLLGAALNASNIGVVGPTAFYADTPVVLTANGSNFTSGKVRVSIHR